MSHRSIRPALLLLVAALGISACSSSSKKSTSSSTTTTTSVEGTGPDITSFSVPANVDCSRGAIDVAWTTRDVKDVALLVDNVQVASGPAGKGDTVLVVPCDGKAHVIGIRATASSGQVVSAAKTTKTTPTPAPSTTITTTPNPTACIGFAQINQMIGKYVARSGIPGLFAQSATCVGNYDLVTFRLDGTDTAAKVLFLVNGTQVLLVGAPTLASTPPTYVYQTCQLDPEALGKLGLPALVKTGGKGVQNCGSIAWG